MSPTKAKIICIEDEPETARLLAEDLGERGYDLELAADGQLGLAAIIRQQPDLVLCDISMPAMSGFEVLERLNSLAPRFQEMPFIFLTALQERDVELKGRRLGAGDFVTKPIDFEVLATIIEARLARVARMAVWPRAIVLHPHEVDALTWSARGNTSEEIAELMGLSKRTVDFHIDNARTKLGVATRTEAAVKAVSGGLIAP